LLNNLKEVSQEVAQIQMVGLCVWWYKKVQDQKLGTEVEK
jgi:hypothetical protein